MISSSDRKRIESSVAGGIRRPGFMPASTFATPEAPRDLFSTGMDDLNRSIVEASLSQISDDLRIQRLMFTPVSQVRSSAGKETV